jgi:hypothetical protein
MQSEPYFSTVFSIMFVLIVMMSVMGILLEAGKSGVWVCLLSMPARGMTRIRYEYGMVLGALFIPLPSLFL